MEKKIKAGGEFGKIGRGAGGKEKERMAAADKLRARNAQTAAVNENDESGIIVTLQRALSWRDIFLRDNIYLPPPSAFTAPIMGSVPGL